MVKTSPSNARGAGSIPGQGSRIPHASWPKHQNIKKKKKKQYCNKFNKNFKKWSTSKKKLIFYFSRKSPHLGLVCKFQPTFMACGSNDSFIFPALAMPFLSAPFSWCCPGCHSIPVGAACSVRRHVARLPGGSTKTSRNSGTEKLMTHRSWRRYRHSAQESGPGAHTCIRSTGLCFGVPGLRLDRSAQTRGSRALVSFTGV